MQYGTGDWRPILRQTRQRIAINRVFDENPRPLGPEEVQQLAQGDVEGLNLATVYRNLKSLVEQGELVAVEIPGQPARYEKSGLSHHHHFLCNRCNQVYDLPGCGAQLSELAPDDFVIESHEILLYGSCADCA